MADEVCVFAGFELFEDVFERIADGIEAAWVHLLEQALDLGEDLLDRIEVRAVGRQIQQVHSRAFEAFADTGNFVGGQVIDDDDATRHHFGDQALFKPLAEDHAGHRAWEQLRGEDAVMRQPCDKGGRHPVTVRGLGEELLALVAPAMAAGHRRVGAGFIDEHEVGKVETRLSSLPQLTRQGDVRPVLLRRKYRFFEAKSQALHAPPDRGPADKHAPLRQVSLNIDQAQVAPIGQHSGNVGVMIEQHGPAIPTHRTR
jgi:hypothetical protein